MKKRPSSVLRLASPFGAWGQRVAFLLLIGVAFALMLLSRADSRFAEQARTAVSDFFSPVLSHFASPVETIGDIIQQVRDMAALRAENVALREENERLLAWEVRARQLAAENASLRELSNFSVAPAAGQITARVIADSSNAFVRSLLVLAGKPDGVIKGQAAVTGQGLVGRVTAVGERASRVLLVTDINSRIPVQIDRTRERAVLAGNNSSSPNLIYLPPETGVQVGDRIVTSGHGGVFPKGIPVGIVTVVDGETVLLRPHFDWSRIEYLRLIDYKLPGILGGRPERGPEAGP